MLGDALLFHLSAPQPYGRQARRRNRNPLAPVGRSVGRETSPPRGSSKGLACGEFDLVGPSTPRASKGVGLVWGPISESAQGCRGGWVRPRRLGIGAKPCHGQLRRCPCPGRRFACDPTQIHPHLFLADAMNFPATCPCRECAWILVAEEGIAVPWATSSLPVFRKGGMGVSPMGLPASCRFRAAPCTPNPEPSTPSTVRAPARGGGASVGTRGS
jgi:hypothetical protein